MEIRPNAVIALLYPGSIFPGHNAAGFGTQF